MVKHIVLWKLKDFAENNSKEENAKIIKQRLEALKDIIPGIEEMQVGINENGGEYDAVLVSTFKSTEDLKAYDCHPEHVKVREFITKVRLSRTSADYTI